ncbi:MAG: long-chain fatty acid--CoA ligase [Muribaculaceae bacterium]|nr:long-chain fatty acid--CoA ligase [Muribaculaceae bacterium]
MPNILTDLVRVQAAAYGTREAFSAPNADGTEWKPTSWTAFKTSVDAGACALAELGLKEQNAIAIFSSNRPEILITDFAAYTNRSIPISIYSTSSLEQVVYIVNDSGASILFAGDASQYEIARKAMTQCPSLRYIVTMDDVAEEGHSRSMTFREFIERGLSASKETAEAVESRRIAATADDIATIIYTSGTTGEPKGAVLPHSCFNEQLTIHKGRLDMLSENDTSLCFLPLSHIFEKAWTYFCLYIGIKVFINYDPRAIQQSITMCRPTCMCSVPRFWEKVYTAVQDKISRMNPVSRLLAKEALKVGRRRNLNYARLGEKAPWWLEMRYRFFFKHVFLPMQKVIGVENGNIFPTAGAPLSAGIVEFFHSCGINIVIGYGLSETTATVTCFPAIGYEIGTVGTTLPGIDVRIGDDNEILVKGPTVMREYYNKPEATAEAFTADGWFRTGDAGFFNHSGALILTERIKDLFKTSNGKYIAPQALESRLGEDPYIEQVAVIGDQRKYVTALIVPAYEALKKYAREKHIQYKNIDELVKNSEIRRMISERIEKLQRNFASFERIKKFVLLPREFSMEAGELTNTLKIKRPVLNRRYAHEIEEMYAS